MMGFLHRACHKAHVFCHRMHNPLHAMYFAFVAMEAGHLYGYIAAGLLCITIVDVIDDLRV